MSCAVSFLNFVKIFFPAHTSRKSIPPSVQPPPRRSEIQAPSFSTRTFLVLPLPSRHAFLPFALPCPFLDQNFLSPCSINIAFSSPLARTSSMSCAAFCSTFPHPPPMQMLVQLPVPSALSPPSLPPAAISRSGPRSPCISLFPFPSISSPARCRAPAASFCVSSLPPLPHAFPTHPLARFSAGPHPLPGPSFCRHPCVFPICTNPHHNPASRFSCPFPRAPSPFAHKKKAPARKPSRIDFRFSVLCGRIPRLSALSL